MSDLPRVPKPYSYFVNLPENRFHFEVEVGDEVREVSLPKFEWIGPLTPAGKRLKEASTDANQNPYDLTREVIGILNPELGEIVKGYEDDQIDWIAAMWQQASGRSLPESSASSTSSPNTKGPSSSTSSAKGSGSAKSASKTSTAKTSSRSSSTRSATQR